MSELEQIRNLENDSPQCQNCIDTVYMDDLGDGFYRCPVCGDEWDTRYPPSDPFEDDDDENRYEDYYEEDWDDYDGWPEYANYFIPPTRRELLVWRLQVWRYCVKHPIATLRYWHHRNIERCADCGKRNRNCDCIPF